MEEQRYTYDDAVSALRACGVNDQLIDRVLQNQSDGQDFTNFVIRPTRMLAKQWKQDFPKADFEFCRDSEDMARALRQLGFREDVVSNVNRNEDRKFERRSTITCGRHAASQVFLDECPATVKAAHALWIEDCIRRKP